MYSLRLTVVVTVGDVVADMKPHERERDTARQDKSERGQETRTDCDSAAPCAFFVGYHCSAVHTLSSGGLLATRDMGGGPPSPAESLDTHSVSLESRTNRLVSL